MTPPFSYAFPMVWLASTLSGLRLPDGPSAVSRRPLDRRKRQLRQLHQLSLRPVIWHYDIPRDILNTNVIAFHGYYLWLLPMVTMGTTIYQWHYDIAFNDHYPGIHGYFPDIGLMDPSMADWRWLEHDWISFPFFRNHHPNLGKTIR